MAGCASIAFSQDGRTFFTWGSRVVQAWDRATGREKFAVMHNLDCRDCAESPDGRILATASYDGYLRFWNTTDGQEARPPIAHPSQVLTVNFSPDGRRVATTCLDAQARVWDVSTGKLEYAMSHLDWPTDMRFTPDGHFVMVGDASGVQLFDAGTGIGVSRRCVTGSSSAPMLDIAHGAPWVLIAGARNNFFSVVNLQLLIGGERRSPEEALLWAELLSKAQITGSDLVNLSNAEWLERWQKYRGLHPEIQPFEAVDSTSPPHGAIGLATWSTAAQYKDVKVVSGANVLFQSDFSKDGHDWRAGSGRWDVIGGAIQQSSDAQDCRATTGDAAWTDYTLTLKARKLGGAEGFLIMFHVQDEGTFLWWNIGGWNNTKSVIEQSVNGTKHNVGSAVQMTVENDRWYDIRVEVQGRLIKCYLDGNLVSEALDSAIYSN
jgi:hypothetical protein